MEIVVLLLIIFLMNGYGVFFGFSARRVVIFFFLPTYCWSLKWAGIQRMNEVNVFILKRKTQQGTKCNFLLRRFTATLLLSTDAKISVMCCSH